MYLGVVNFKTKYQKFLRTLLIFTPIPLDAQEVWSLNQLDVYVLERMNECLTLTYIPFYVLVVSLLITDLSNWVSLIGLSN